MEKIWNNADDKNVATVILYADKDDGNVFFDSVKKNGVSKDELANLFKKGVLVSLNNVLYMPISYKESSGAGVISVSDDGTAYVFYSKEHSEA